MTNPLHQLETMVLQGMQPVRRELWLGLGFRPPKRSAIAVEAANLPKVDQCRAVVGLDVIVTYHGDTTRYGTLRTLCGALMAASPRRLLAIDLDAKKIAFLKLGES